MFGRLHIEQKKGGVEQAELKTEQSQEDPNKGKKQLSDTNALSVELKKQHP